MKWRKGIPDSLYVPTMAGIPTSLLNKLEKCNFDLFHGRLQKEWRLPMKSFYYYHMRLM